VGRLRASLDFFAEDKIPCLCRELKPRLLAIQCTAQSSLDYLKLITPVIPKVRKQLFLIVQFSQSCRCSKPLRDIQHGQRPQCRSHTYPLLLKNQNYLYTWFDLIVHICLMHVKFLLTSTFHCEWHSWICYVTNTSCELLLVIMCKCLTHSVVAETGGSTPPKPTPGHVPYHFHLHPTFTA